MHDAARAENLHSYSEAGAFLLVSAAQSVRHVIRCRQVL